MNLLVEYILNTKHTQKDENWVCMFQRKMFFFCLMTIKTISKLQTHLNSKNSYNNLTWQLLHIRILTIFNFLSKIFCNVFFFYRNINADTACFWGLSEPRPSLSRCQPMKAPQTYDSRNEGRYSLLGRLGISIYVIHSHFFHTGQHASTLFLEVLIKFSRKQSALWDRNQKVFALECASNNGSQTTSVAPRIDSLSC